MEGSLHIEKDLILLILLAVANSAPILARIVLKERLAAPVDLGQKFLDKRPIFGAHKTYRGLASSLMATTLCSMALGYGASLGLRLALLSMLADLGSSFLKRRLGLKSGARATMLDQVPEALLPLWVLKTELGIGYLDILGITGLFFVLEVFLSPLLYALKIRRAPY